MAKICPNNGQGVCVPETNSNWSRFELMVNEFCNQLALTQKGIRNMHSWYLFSDKRPGTVRERFEMDAKSYFECEKMFRGEVK